MDFRPAWVSKINDYAQQEIPFLAVIAFDRNNGEVFTMDECRTQNVLFEINGKSNHSLLGETIIARDISFESPTFELYERQFNRVMHEINHGNTYLLNLCTATKISGKLDLLRIFQGSQARYRLFYKDHFVVFSPEKFVEIRGSQLKTHIR